LSGLGFQNLEWEYEEDTDRSKHSVIDVATDLEMLAFQFYDLNKELDSIEGDLSKLEEMERK
jgi:hypothetical protein